MLFDEPENSSNVSRSICGFNERGITPCARPRALASRETIHFVHLVANPAQGVLVALENTQFAPWSSKTP